MTKHIELTDLEKEYIEGHFVEGAMLFDSVERFEFGKLSLEGAYIVFTSSECGVVIQEDYLRDLRWVAAYPTSVEVDFERRRK